MESLVPLKAWALAHPYECLVLIVVLLSILNGLLKGPPTSLLGVILDRLSVLVRSDAQGTLSWPLIGRSVFEAARDHYVPPAKPGAPAKREGFARTWALYAVCAVCFVLAALLTACPLPPPDGCAPMATRCSPQGKPQRCSASQRWWSEPTAQPCAALGAVCCPARSPYGNVVHACVPQSVCLPEPTLADALAAEAVDAVFEGGAQ